MKEKIAPWNDPTIRWICEEHPTEEFEHKIGFFFKEVCAGPGMPDPLQQDFKDAKNKHGKKYDKMDGIEKLIALAEARCEREGHTRLGDSITKLQIELGI